MQSLYRNNVTVLRTELTSTQCKRYGTQLCNDVGVPIVVMITHS